MPKIYLSKADIDKYKKPSINSFDIIGRFISKSSEDTYGKNGKDDGDGDEPDPSSKANNIITPPYNKEASPETDPSETVPNYTPPSRDEMTPTEAEECSKDDYDKSISYISQDERDKVAEDDFAGPHKSFPIRNANDVKNAADLVGHAKNPSSVKRKIIEIAKRKGLHHALPNSWKGADEQ